MEGALVGIGMKTINVVIHMDCGGEASWVKLLGEVWPNQSVDQWVDWLTNPSSVEELPNIDWRIAVFPVAKKNYWRTDLDIKSWAKPVKALRDLLKKRCNLRGSLVFCPYHWPDGLIDFSVSSNIQRVWKDYQGLIHNTYNGGNIETDHHVICSMPEDMTNHFSFPNFTTAMPGMLREVIDNGIAPREKISLNGLGMKKVKSGGLSMILKTGLEVDQDYTIFNYGPPIPQKDLKSQYRTILSGPGMNPAPK